MKDNAILSLQSGGLGRRLCASAAPPLPARPFTASGVEGASATSDVGVNRLEVPPEIANHYTADSDPDRDSASFVVTGVLLDGEGASLPDAAIGLSLEPGPELLLDASEADSEAVILTVAAGTTDAEGAFIPTVPALRYTAAHLDEDDEVAALLTSASDSHALRARVYAMLPNVPGVQP